MLGAAPGSLPVVAMRYAVPSRKEHHLPHRMPQLPIRSR